MTIRLTQPPDDPMGMHEPVRTPHGAIILQVAMHTCGSFDVSESHRFRHWDATDRARLRISREYFVRKPDQPAGHNLHHINAMADYLPDDESRTPDLAPLNALLDEAEQQLRERGGLAIRPDDPNLHHPWQTPLEREITGQSESRRVYTARPVRPDHDFPLPALIALNQYCRTNPHPPFLITDSPNAPTVSLVAIHTDQHTWQTLEEASQYHREQPVRPKAIALDVSADGRKHRLKIPALPLDEEWNIIVAPNADENETRHVLSQANASLDKWEELDDPEEPHSQFRVDCYNDALRRLVRAQHPHDPETALALYRCGSTLEKANPSRGIHAVAVTNSSSGMTVAAYPAGTHVVVPSEMIHTIHRILANSNDAGRRALGRQLEQAITDN